MTLLLGAAAIDARRAIARGPLLTLADSLATDLNPLLDREPYIPTTKALLSRVGGRCEADGTDLEFDPTSPHAHRCPTCARVHTGEYHDRWWLYPYQLWLAERAVHAATLGALNNDERHRAFARTILLGYADRYLDYPNVDNVLGPSRLFFSTYLESLWLLHISIAADLLADGGDGETAAIVRDRIIEPAVTLIEQYDEGLSNRQVWNNAAIVAARCFLGQGNGPLVEQALTGIETGIHSAVGPDGSWYEGDNYHQFAHRGLWYGITLGERVGYSFDEELLARFDAGFSAPFLSALPDFTYPARKDSRYAASLRQWRFAESCELGLARRDNETLSWALGRMYDHDLDPGDTERSRASGEAERHAQPVRLSRADLGWKSLLFARESLPMLRLEPPGSITIESQGLTIHRREHGAVYVALDWGESGGGHGHADRLNLLFSTGSARWLDDLGTGSYVDPSLHWYRSTLAHNAPLINGQSQLHVAGTCIARESTGGFDFVSAYLDGIAHGVRVQRTVVTAEHYFIDEVRWDADDAVQFDLPIHFDADADDLTFAPHTSIGGHGLEDGFNAVRNGEAAELPAGRTVRLTASRDGRSAQAQLCADTAATLIRASAPGQPATESRRFYLIRMQGTRGVIRSAWSWTGDVVSADLGGEEELTVCVDGATHTHRITDTDWQIQHGERPELIRFTRERIALDEWATDPRSPAELAAASGALSEPLVIRLHEHDSEWFSELDPMRRTDWVEFALGDAHYRRSELTWHEAGRPRARVAIGADTTGLLVDLFVATDTPVFVAGDATNPFDNEHPDINGHGVQLYLATEDSSGAWILVPEAGSNDVRVRALDGWDGIPAPTAEWRAMAGGFEIRATIPARAGESGLIALDLIVNDATPGRTRRRGQLVMSGSDGECVYLRGDRHDAARLIPFAIE